MDLHTLCKLRIGTRLGTGFGIILAMLMAVLIADTVVSGNNRAAMIFSLGTSNQKSTLANTVKSSLLEDGIAMRNIGLQTELAAMKKEEEKVKALRLQFMQARELLGKLGLTESEKKILADITMLEQQTDAPFKEAIRLIGAFFNSEDVIKPIAMQIDPLNQKALVEINRLVAMGVIAVAVGSLLAWRVRWMK